MLLFDVLPLGIRPDTSDAFDKRLNRIDILPATCFVISLYAKKTHTVYSLFWHGFIIMVFISDLLALHQPENVLLH